MTPTWLLIICLTYSGNSCLPKGGITALNVTKDQCLAIEALRDENYKRGMLVWCFAPNGVEFKR